MSNEGNILEAHYKTKNRRVKISTFIHSNDELGKVYVVESKRLNNRKRREITEVKTVYTQKSLDFILHCLNDFTEQEVSRVRKHNAEDLIEALKQKRNDT